MFSRTQVIVYYHSTSGTSGTIVVPQQTNYRSLCYLLFIVNYIIKLVLLPHYHTNFTILFTTHL